jgi:hypothetical protein
MSDEFSPGLLVLFIFFNFTYMTPPPPKKIKLTKSEIQIYATAEDVFMRSSKNIFTRVLLSSLNVYIHVQRLFRKHCEEVSALKQTSEKQFNLLCN